MRGCIPLSRVYALTFGSVGTVVPPTGNPRDDLVLGVDKPTTTNTGVLAGVARTNVGTSGQNLTYATDDQVITNTTFNCRVSVTGRNVKFKNCMFTGYIDPSSAFGLVQCTNANVRNLYFEDCTFKPAFPHWNWNGIVGHDFYAKRCQFQYCQDGIQVQFSAATWPFQTGTRIEQCLIFDMAWYTAASPGIVHPADMETHNDCIQQMQGGGTIIRGNVLSGWFAKQVGHWIVTDPTTEPYVQIPFNSLASGYPGYGGPFSTRPLPDRGTGTFADGRYNGLRISGATADDNQGDQSCLMIGDEQGKPTFDMTFEDNWCYGGNFAVNGGGNSATLFSADYSIGTMKRNKFDRSQGNQGTGGDTTQTINFQGAGWTSARTDIPTTGIDANVYEDNGDYVTVRY